MSWNNKSSSQYKQYQQASGRKYEPGGSKMYIPPGATVSPQKPTPSPPQDSVHILYSKRKFSISNFIPYRNFWTLQQASDYQSARLPRTSPYSMQQPVQRQVTRPNQSIPKSDTSSEMSNDVIRRLGNMSVSVPNNPKPEDQPKAMTKDERIEIVKGMILEEPNGINLKNLYHKFISKFPEKQNSSNYTYLTSFESFVHQQRQALSCEIDDEGIVSPIAFSAEHFMEIFDKASSDERALNKELTGNFCYILIWLFVKYHFQSGGW